MCERMQMILDGRQCTIGVNLWKALEHLRQNITDISSHEFWIDALCLNFSHTFERSLQVQSMDRIYQGAKKVHVWLGGDPYDLHAVEETFQLMQHIATYKGQSLVPTPNGFMARNNAVASVCQQRRGRCGYCARSNAIVGYSEKRRRDTLARLGLKNASLLFRVLAYTESNNDIWSSVLALMERSYWRRRWVIQEYILAQTVVLHYGSSSMDGEIFDLALTKISGLPHMTLSKYSVMTRSLRAAKDSPALRVIRTCHSVEIGRTAAARPAAPLWRLLDRFRNWECTVPHDRVYALISLAQDVEGSVTVDYEQELSNLKGDLITHYSSHPKRHMIRQILDEVLEDYNVPDGVGDSSEEGAVTPITDDLSEGQVTEQSHKERLQGLATSLTGDIDTFMAQADSLTIQANELREMADALKAQVNALAKLLPNGE